MMMIMIIIIIIIIINQGGFLSFIKTGKGII